MIYAFERTDGKEKIIAVFNFSGEDVEEYELVAEDEKKPLKEKKLRLLIASDMDRFGGTTAYKKNQCWKMKDGKAVLKMPAFSGKLLAVDVK